MFYALQNRASGAGRDLAKAVKSNAK